MLRKTYWKTMADQNLRGYAMSVTELKQRERADFDSLPISNPKANRTVAAIGAAYQEIVELAEAALSAGQSVLIRTPTAAPEALTQCLAGKLSRPISDAFVYSRPGKKKDAFSPDDTILHAARDQVLNFQLNLSARLSQGKIQVLDFLDALFGSYGAEQADLLSLMAMHPGQVYLGFALPGTPLPAALLSCFAVQLALPPLRLDTLWTMLTYDEVKDLLNTPSLTVAHQIALYHAVAGLDAWRFRQIIAALGSNDDVAPHFFDIVDEIKRRLGFRPPQDVSRPARYSQLISPMQQAIVEPFNRYRNASQDSDMAWVYEEKPRGVLLTGGEAGSGREIARWLAAALPAQLVLTTGAALLQANALFSQIYPLPAVLFIDGVDEGLLGGGEPLRAFLACWRAIPRDHPVFVLGALSHEESLPAAVRRHFPLIYSAKES
jgi:hypothetical protein